MQRESVRVTLAYPDGSDVTFSGNGAIVYTSDSDERRLFAVTGVLTLSDVVHLISELMNSFSEADVTLAASLALVARRMDSESPD